MDKQEKKVYEGTMVTQACQGRMVYLVPLDSQVCLNFLVYGPITEYLNLCELMDLVLFHTVSRAKR